MEVSDINRYTIDRLTKKSVEVAWGVKIKFSFESIMIFVWYVFSV